MGIVPTCFNLNYYIMVTVKDYKKRETKNGEEFFVLVLQGAIVPIKSKESGRMYFTAKTATAASTFDEDTCKQIIGSQFPGEIVKVEVAPYEYALPETGEVITLEHRWEYQDESFEKIIAENIIEETQVL